MQNSLAISPFLYKNSLTFSKTLYRFAIMKRKVRTYSASDPDIGMLEALAAYHGFSKSGTITSLIKKEFWRIFPSGTNDIRPVANARIKEFANENLAR